MKSISIGLIFFILFSFSAMADDPSAHSGDQNKADLIINAGWAVGLGPEFFGSSKLELKHRPVLDLRYKDRLHIFGPKIRYSLYNDSGLSAGPLLNYSEGRKESDNPMLKGLGDNADNIEVGAFLHYKKDRFQIRLEGKSGLGDNAGETLSLSILHGLYRSEKTSWLMVLRAQLFSQQEMQRQFGITERQSAMSVSNLSAYRPESGISNGNLILLGEYKLTGHTSLIFVSSFWQLMSDAKNSPLIRSDFGKDFQSLYGLALIYKF